MFTKMEVAKQTATLVTSIAISRVISNTITSVLDVDDDNVAVTVASAIGGWYVAGELKETTDAYVEKAAAKLQNLRSKTTEQQA